MYLSLFLALYTLTLFFIAFFEEIEKEKTRQDKLQYYPKVAVIVPAYNEEETIESTVNSLLALDYPKDRLKIYVVNDGSKDKTWEVLQSYRDNKQVSLLSKENGGKASAMNFAFERLEADTELVGILDADSFVKKDALLEMVKKFQEDPKYSAVTPAIKIYNPNKIIRFLQNAEYNLSVWLRKSFDNLGTIFIIPGPFSFYKKEALDTAGPWKHAHGTEDLEMGLRFQEMGLKIANTSKAVVYTVSPDTVYKLYKQRLRWTYGFLNNAWDYRFLFFNPKGGALSFFALPVSVLSIIFALYIFFYGIYTFIKTIVEKVLNIYEFGLSLSLPDFFYWNFSLTLWLAIILVVSAYVATKMGDTASGERNLRFKDQLAYIFLYGFIAPFWLFVALYKTIRGQSVKWVKVNK